MSEFKPTFLYIKRHSKTGLMYFGKTQQNPETYPGSGKYWKRHFKKHGKEFIETLWYCLFLEKETIESCALSFSQTQNISLSTEWANLKDENGLDGNPTGVTFSEEHKAKLSASGLARPPKSQETRQRLSIALTGRIFSDEHKENLRNARSNSQALKDWYNSGEAGQVISESLKGLMWWSSKTTSIKARECPGDGWVRGKEYIEFKTPKGTFYSYTELRKVYPNVWWKGVWDQLDKPINKHAIQLSPGLYLESYLGKTRREVGFDKIKFPRNSP